MKNYDHKKIEKSIQKYWENKKIFSASKDSKKPKFYGLIEFPYPSGDGLHVGHIRSNTAMDIISRKRRMQGYNVLYPIGWDAFGLPTENYAIKTGKKPALVTKKNTDTFRRQLKEVGFSFDWSREINTTDPKYYKWTQWIFLQFFKKGLAYKAKKDINWCPKCKIGLANEEAIGGVCDRCGGNTEKKEKEQWMLAITKYADRLDKDLDLVDYPERVKTQQRNWIGKSEGMLFTSPIKDSDLSINTFSAHFEAFEADTFVVIAPDHPLLKNIIKDVENKEEILSFAKKIIEKRKKNIDTKELEGIFTGKYIIDPVSKKDLPIWVASYALADYGTGIVKCSAHDERDFSFAKKYNIRLKTVLFSGDIELDKKIENLEICFSDMKNSFIKEPREFNGMKVGNIRNDIVIYLEKNNLAKRQITYKLRDWVFSRQRYWGEPIPIIECKKCGYIPVPEKELPVKLPDVKSYKPTDTGESPLANIKKWVNVKCPKCKGSAKRETDTMPNWAGSSWYYLRYIDPKNNKNFADKKKLKYWTPIDWYNGGMEHTTLHLLYSRFWHKFLYDLKFVPTVEPYKKRTSHGMILGAGGVKMSKSLGNVVNPDEIVKIYGADTLRIYEMFMGPFDESVAWSTESIIGSRRFIEKVWRIQVKFIENSQGSKKSPVNEVYHSFQKLLHKTIKKVSEDIENMRFNTAISSMMMLATEMEKNDFINKSDFKIFLQILYPFAPHISEYLWFSLGEKKSISFSCWPEYNKDLTEDQEIKIAVQVNGKVRSEILINMEDSEDKIKERVLIDENIKKYIIGPIKRIVYVKNRIINILV